MFIGSPRKFCLVLVVAMAVTGCSGKSDVRPSSEYDEALNELRAEIHSAISDPEREAQVIAIIDEFALNVETLRVGRMERQVQFKKLNADYDTSRAQFDIFIKASNQSNYLHQQHILKQRTALIAVTTPAEWNRIHEARMRLIDRTFKTIQSI